MKQTTRNILVTLLLLYVVFVIGFLSISLKQQIDKYNDLSENYQNYRNMSAYRENAFLAEIERLDRALSYSELNYDDCNKDLNEAYSDIATLNYKLKLLRETVNNKTMEIIDAEFRIKEIQQDNQEQDEVRGSYQHKSGMIRLYTAEMNSVNEIEKVSAHELAHYVWYNKLGTTRQNEYSSIADKNTALSRYSNTSVVEDFAETVMFARSCYWDYSDIPKERADFIKNNLESDYK